MLKGLARVVPIGFGIGAGVELFMIKVPVGGQTFCMLD